MKRLLLYFSLFIFHFSFSFAQQENTFLFLHGDGTQAKPYLIDSYEALVEFREKVALESEAEYVYAVVTNDIDLGTDPNWAPIGQWGKRKDQRDKAWFFKGEVDGMEHTINNLTIDKYVDDFRTDPVWLGLFARDNGQYTTMKNFTLKNVNINVTLDADLAPNRNIYVGGLIGYSCGMMKNVHVDGNINVIDNSDEYEMSRREVNVGGVAGKICEDGNLYYNSDGDSPSDLHADINISSNALGSNIGGIAGCTDSIGLARCTSSGLLTARVVEPVTYYSSTLNNISIGGICGYVSINRMSTRFDALCSTARVYGGNWGGGLIGYMYMAYAPVSSTIRFSSCYAAGGVMDSYNYAGGLVGRSVKYTGTRVNSYISFKDCYYAGTLHALERGSSASMIGNYTGNDTYTEYGFTNCFWDSKMASDATDYQSLLGVGTPQSMPAYIYGYDTQQAIGTDTHFTLLANEMDWIYAAGRYPQLKSIASMPVSTLATIPIFFSGGDWAERVYQGATLSAATCNGEEAIWSAPMGKGSVAGLKLMSDEVGYEILTLSSGTCTKRLNLYMAYSDQAWEGEDHIPNGDKSAVFEYGNGTSANPYLIMNAGQLAYALKNNLSGEYYKIEHDIIINRNLLQSVSGAVAWLDTKKTTYRWQAILDGGGYMVRGLYQPVQSSTDNGHQHGLLGSIVQGGRVSNMGIVEAVISDDFSNITSEADVGILAGSVESGASVENCFTTGVIQTKAQQGLLFLGGLCGRVDGTVTDCMNGATVMSTDRTVMVENDQLGGICGKASGAVFTRCINVGRVSHYDDYTYQSSGGICPGSGYSATDCYYDLQASACSSLSANGTAGKTTSQMTDGTILKGSSRWTVGKGLYPVLSDFAHTDHMKMLARPMLLAEGECAALVRNILEVPVQGTMAWSITDGGNCLNFIPTYGLAEPKSAGTARLLASMSGDGIHTSYHVAYLTVADDYVKGIRFEDQNAEQACVDAFGSDGVLTLEQAMSVTDFTPFRNHVATSSIRSFPEMRYFLGVSRLSNQLSACGCLEHVDLPLSLKTIAADAFSGCASLTTVTVPKKLTKVEPYAFRGSQVSDIQVATDNSSFVSRNGVLFDAGDYIVAYPPCKSGSTYMYTDVLKGIYTGAFYGADNLEKLYIGDDEGTYIDLRNNAIPTDKLLFVNDATDNSDYIDLYRYDESRDWHYFDEQDALQRYYPLKITSAKHATTCIYFDTELPSGLTAYYCYEVNQDDGVVHFRKLGKLIPAGLPVLIRGNNAGTYPLLEYDGRIDMPVDYSDYYLGSGEHGFIVGDQSASSGTTEGSILTLGRNSQGTLGFFFYKNNTNKIPAYRAYIVIQTLNVKSFTISLEESTGDVSIPISNFQLPTSKRYNLSGQQVDDSYRGIVIQNGKKYLKK